MKTGTLGLSTDQREALVRRMADAIVCPHSDHHQQADSAAVWQARAALAEVESRLVDLGVAKVAPFQQRVDLWMDVCFGDAIKADTLERADRFTEEALELVQTFPTFTADRAHALVNYVFGRPVGEPSQEVGGVMITLAALCNASGLDMAEAKEIELTRIWTKVAQIRAKQATKPVGSALPVEMGAN